MVPINFHQYCKEIKKELLARKESLANDWDGFLAAWLVYGLSMDGLENNLPLSDLVTRMEQWASQKENWKPQRNFGPLAFLCWLQKQTGKTCDADLIAILSERIQGLNVDDKLSLLRDPEQVFLLALGLGVIEEVRARLVEVAKRELMRGPLRRRVLYAAALREMGESVKVPTQEVQDAGDLVALVWWAERYPGELKKDEQWQSYSNIIESVSISSNEAGDSQRVLTVPELALLYEAVCREALQPDPVLLFEYFPLHPRVREIASDYFYNGKYVTAVFQACMVLNELIQERSGVFDKYEAELVQATMKQIGDPTKLKIKFNVFLDEDSGKSEQAGLASICEGVFKAFRNPKGHKPEDHSFVQLDPYEALEQLVIISFLMERIEKAAEIPNG
ncbi:TIGR02391 family protein [Candidatus Woesearchaeota archaeon]|nr:MAG: TIGR02391 family protein [Candidatus Woesearchaeota archaeon]